MKGKKITVQEARWMDDNNMYGIVTVSWYER